MQSELRTTQIQTPVQQQPYKTISKNSLFFIIFTIMWQIAAIIIIGIFFGYDNSINPSPVSTNVFGNKYINMYLMMAFLIFVLAGLTLTSAYITFSSSTNMTFSILVSVFTLQNWFIYRCFWNKTGLPLSPMVGSFDGLRYNEIAYLPTNNFRPATADYATASFYDAIGACIAMFCAISPLLGRIGFFEVFFISWVGPFFYEINSSIFNKFFIVDTGFGMRGFLFGGMLGLWLSFMIGRKPQSKQGSRFMSHYYVNAMALIGCVIMCLTYPSLVSTGLQYYKSSLGTTLAGVAQINMWFAMGGSVVGVFIANSFTYRKISVHDVIFVSLAGSISFSSSSALNFNPGAAIAIGSGIGFICALIHTPFKRWMNDGGVIESNSVVVQFIIPGIFACVFSSIMQAVNQGQFNILDATTGTVINTKMQDPARSPSGNAGWQLMGFVFSLGSSIICGIILGFLFKCTRNHRSYWYFNDQRFIDFGGNDAKYDENNREEVE